MLCLPCVLVARKYLLLNIFQNHLVGFFSSVPDDTSSANCHLINLVIRCNRLLFIYHRCHRHRHPPSSSSSCTIIIIIVAIKIQEPPTWVEQASMSEVPVVFLDIHCILWKMDIIWLWQHLSKRLHYDYSKIPQISQMTGGVSGGVCWCRRISLCSLELSKRHHRSGLRPIRLAFEAK